MASSTSLLEHRKVWCKSNKIAIIRTSQQFRSKGRQFYGCRNYGKDNANYCDFFMWCDIVKSKELAEQESSNFLNLKEGVSPEQVVPSPKASNEEMLQCINYKLSSIAEQIENLKIGVEEASTKAKSMVERIEAERKFFIIFILAILCIKYLFA